MRPLIAGNWKMNGLASALVQVEALKRGLMAAPPRGDVLICPPFTLIADAVRMAGGAFAIGGQDCRAQASGAFTGDISAEMLKDAGASAVIVGHSERRQYHGESSAQISAKAEAAWRAGLLAIICIGEKEAERNAGRELDVCSDQLQGSVPQSATAANTAIAYEPVWAIGTGRTATAADIAAMHAHIREGLVEELGDEGASIRILYGGSVKAENAAEILATAEVGGALVGGASLQAAEFLKIIAAAP